MQDSHVVDHPGLADPRGELRIICSTRISHITRVSRMLRNKVQDIALRMALDKATGVGTSRHRTRSNGVPIPSAVPKFKRGDQIPIKLWIQQIESYFPSKGIPERKPVM